MSSDVASTSVSVVPEVKPPSARVLFWATFALIPLFGVVVPALNTANQFSRGYFLENELPIAIVLSTFFTAGYLVLLALATMIFRLRVRMSRFALAFVVQLATAAVSIEYLRMTFESITLGSVTRAQEVVDAIHVFQSARGRAPRYLKELVPEFLPDDRELLYANGPGLYYEYAPITDTWSFRIHTLMERISLEYAPGTRTRPLIANERRIGDWIVWSSFPDGGAANLYEVFEPLVTALGKSRPPAPFRYE